MGPHPALLIGEILEQVFAHLRINWEDDRGEESKMQQASLACAARVCTTFYEPAMNTLWWSIPGIQPVLHLLATLSWLSVSQVGGHSGLGLLYTMTDQPKSPRSASWERLCRYAAHTRVIQAASSDISAHPDVYSFLGSSRTPDDQPLFRNLCVMTCHVYSLRSGDVGILRLANPRIDRLRIHFGALKMRGRNWWLVFRAADRPAEGPTLDHLLQDALKPGLVGLVELEVQATHNIPYARDSKTWSCLAQLQSLRKLTLDQACLVKSYTSLQGLASLPVLTELSLYVTSHDRWRRSSYRGFQALERLSLNLYSHTDIDALNLFDSPGLRTLSVSLRQAKQDTIPVILDHVATTYPRIQSITIKDRMGESLDDPSAVPSFEAVFGKLSQRETIEEIVISTAEELYLCTATDIDSDLARLARSWPNLRVFSLTSEPREARITHRALAAFAEHCSNLRALHLRGVDLSGLTEEELRTLPPSTCPLEELGVCTLHDRGDAKRSALFLRTLFPRLDVVKTMAWDCPSCSPSWDKRCTLALKGLLGHPNVPFSHAF
ncbi:hypothetical protein C8Q77DRAFT_1139507 [Trametes polyzona]|nr:hypothetical protein C8Q77DRAFT_1139507 [Trametes polyzona]